MEEEVLNSIKESDALVPQDKVVNRLVELSEKHANSKEKIFDILYNMVDEERQATFAALDKKAARYQEIINNLSDDEFSFQFIYSTSQKSKASLAVKSMYYDELADLYAFEMQRIISSVNESIEKCKEGREEFRTELKGLSPADRKGLHEATVMKYLGLGSLHDHCSDIEAEDDFQKAICYNFMNNMLTEIEEESKEAEQAPEM